VDGHKSEIMRVVQGLNMLMTGLFLLAPTVDQYARSHLSQRLDGIQAQWLLVMNWLGSLGLEFGLQHAAIKEKEAGEKK
jgi:hypothetical protein